MQHRSVAQRLKRAKSSQVKQNIALDWATNWHKEQAELINRLGNAISTDNYDDLCIAAGQLKAVTDKRFAALPNILNSLSQSED